MPLMENIDLGGTARSPADIRILYDLGLKFAEIPISKPEKFFSMIKDFKKLKNETGLYYLCHGPREGDPRDIETLEKEYLPKINRILPLMEELNISILTLHLWVDPRFLSQDIIFFKTELLGRIIKRAQRSGITICIENLSENESHMTNIFQKLPFLYMTLDIGHAQLLTKINTSYGFIDYFPERIMHIHVHDNNGGDSHLDDLHLPLGEGIIDFARIFKRLEQIEYKKTITLELKPDEIKKCLKNLQLWAKQSDA